MLVNLNICPSVHRSVFYTWSYRHNDTRSILLLSSILTCTALEV